MPRADSADRAADIARVLRQWKSGVPVPSSWAPGVQAGVSRLRDWWHTPDPEVEAPEGSEQELALFLREAAVMLCRAGEPTTLVTALIEEIGHRYHAVDTRCFVLPTGVFIGIGEVVQFRSVQESQLRLDQIDRLFRFLHQVRAEPIPPEQGLHELTLIADAPPRFGLLARIAGYVAISVGLGLLSRPEPLTVIGYACLGFVVACLRELSAKLRGGSSSLLVPAIAAIVVTVLAFRYAGPILNEEATTLLIPPLVAFLPGAALTLGTMELATGSVVAGASRLVYGTNVLVLIAFGVAVGTQLATIHPVEHAGQHHPLGMWATWVGVVLLAAGYSLFSSASKSTLPWLIAVMCVAHGAQVAVTWWASPLFGAFAGGATLPLAALLLARWRTAPSALVLFLPAFWVLVPGSLGLTGVSEILVSHDTAGIGALVDTVLTVAAIALGVLATTSAVMPAYYRRSLHA
ncbi:threonine/serine exporter family protein [Nocardia sp. NPDC050712]|uniref:threonine/serine ThrE exporter family protein n=1 Tax=Nocardia sp. NPDC050712 TaxID=3155518 RepID=UPI0033D7D823